MCFRAHACVCVWLAASASFLRAPPRRVLSWDSRRHSNVDNPAGLMLSANDGVRFRIVALSGDSVATELNFDTVTPDKCEKRTAKREKARASPDGITTLPTPMPRGGGFDFRGINMAQSESAWNNLTAVAAAQSQPKSEPPQATASTLSLADMFILLLRTLGMICCTCCCFPCAVAIRRRCPTALRAKLHDFPVRAM